MLLSSVAQIVLSLPSKPKEQHCWIDRVYGSKPTLLSGGFLMQVAGVSGDVRRVLQLSRKAAEICEEECCPQARDLPSLSHSQLAARVCLPC